MFRYLVITLLLLKNSHSLPTGAPKGTCQTMLPFHGGGISAQTSPSPFIVVPELTQLAMNSKLKVAVGSRQGIQFGGLMLQARTQAEGEIIGTWEQVPEGTKTIECLGPKDTVTHASPAKKGPLLQFEWQPPENYRGFVIFNATVAQDYATFWVGLESEPVQVMRRSEITNPQIPSLPQSTRTTTPPNFIPVEEKIVKEDDPFYKGCWSEKGCFGAPDGCVRTQDCKAVVATIVRGERFEFEMKAPRDAGYIAFALSDDDKMGDDSVIECVREQNGVKAYMSRTIPRDNLNVERLQKPQEGIQLLSSNLTNGEIYCRVSRDPRTTVNGRRYDLVNDRYFLLVASGKEVKSNKVGFHDIAYLPAAEARYLSDVTEIRGASKILIRLHGAFMLVAWVGTASVGILLARYYRQTWVGSQICGKDLWFAWHRFFMVCTWSLTVVAFVLIFVELKAWSSERNPHAILGVITTAICFLQPIGAYFRPHPGTPKRAVFNWLHWLGGNVCHILGIVTIFFAVKLNKAELPEWMDWVLVAYVAFHVILHLILSILGCVSDRASESRVTAFPMKDLGSNGRTSHSFDRKPDAPNTGARKFILALYLFVIIIFVAAMVVIIVLAPVEETWNKYWKKMQDKM